MNLRETLNGKSVPVLWVVQGVLLPCVAALWMFSIGIERRASDDRLQIRQEISSATANTTTAISRKLERIDDRLIQIQRDQGSIVKDFGKMYYDLLETISNKKRR